MGGEGEDACGDEEAEGYGDYEVGWRGGPVSEGVEGVGGEGEGGGDGVNWDLGVC